MRSDIGAPAWDKLKDCKTLLIHLLFTVMNLGLECRVLLRETSEYLSLYLLLRIICNM